MSNRVELCKAEEVAAGTALRVEAAGLTVAVFNVDGQFYVTDDACTHGPGSLAEGYLARLPELEKSLHPIPEREEYHCPPEEPPQIRVRPAPVL